MQLKVPATVGFILLWIELIISPPNDPKSFSTSSIFFPLGSLPREKARVVFTTNYGNYNGVRFVLLVLQHSVRWEAPEDAANQQFGN
jgi:hypothetical protein